LTATRQRAADPAELPAQAQLRRAGSQRSTRPSTSPAQRPYPRHCAICPLLSLARCA